MKAGIYLGKEKVEMDTGHKVTVGGEFGHETISRVVRVGKHVKDFTFG